MLCVAIWIHHKKQLIDEHHHHHESQKMTRQIHIMATFWFRFQSQSIVYSFRFHIVYLHTLFVHNIHCSHYIYHKRPNSGVFFALQSCPFPFNGFTLDLELSFHRISDAIFDSEDKPNQIEYGLCGEHINRQIGCFARKYHRLIQCSKFKSDYTHKDWYESSLILVAIRQKDSLIIMSQNACINDINLLLGLLSDAYTCLFYFV